MTLRWYKHWTDTAKRLQAMNADGVWEDVPTEVKTILDCYMEMESRSAQQSKQTIEDIENDLP